MTTKLTFLDFFAGVGGFRAGFEKAGGFKCLGHCEIDKYANASYNTIFNTEGEWYASDITEVQAVELPRADLWCGGFPCQDASIAGAGLGLAGGRTGLFYEFTRLIRESSEENRPTYLLLENVTGILSSPREPKGENGKDFLRLLLELGEIGYDAEWQTVNSADLVAQNRERIFIAGYYRGRSPREIFFK